MNRMRLALSLLVPLALASCASVNQTVRYTPVDPGFPVSASRSLQVGDTTYGEEKLTSGDSFVVTQKLKVPFKKTDADLGLAPILQAQIKGSAYNAITQLKVSVRDVNNDTATWIAADRTLGLAFLASGAGLVGFATQGPSDSGTSYLPSIVMGGIGAALLGTSYLLENTGTINYTFDITGVKVKY